MEYSCFIAYHGSKKKTGTYVMGLDLAAFIDKLTTVYGKCYCGPDTDEHNFEEHSGKVIPFSKTFLLVLNDACPVLDTKGECEYLAREVASFRELIKNNERNKKDFAVYYCGNLQKNPEDRRNFVESRLSLIDPDKTFSTGNHNIVVNLNELKDFVMRRIENKEVYFSGEYVPFVYLVEQLQSFVATDEKSLLLQLDEGMGKTRLINWMSEDDTNSEHFNNNYVKLFPIYFPVGGFTSFGRFLDSFVLAFTQGRKTKKSLYDYGGEHVDAKSFCAYVNEVADELYHNQRIIIALDAIDQSYTVAHKNPLSLFSDLSGFYSNIRFIFTAKKTIDKQGAKYVNNFINNFGGRRIALSLDSMAFEFFWEEYYRKYVLNQFPESTLRDFTPNIERKDMVTLNLLFRIATIYLADLGLSNMDKADPRVVSSVKEALAFYLTYLGKLDKSQKFMNNSPVDLLVALSMVEEMTAEEIASTGKMFMKSGFEQHLNLQDALSILVCVSDKLGKAYYSVRYESIKHKLLKDNPDKVNDLFMRLAKILDDSKPLHVLVSDNPTLHLFYKFFAEDPDVTPMVASRIRPLIMHTIDCFKEYAHNESDMVVMAKQTDILGAIVRNESLYESLPDIYAAKLLTKYAGYLQWLRYSEESAYYFEKALLLWNRQDENTMSVKDKCAYYEFYSFFANIAIRTKCSMCTIDLFKKAYELAEELYTKHRAISLISYAHIIFSYGNVCSMPEFEYGEKNERLSFEEDKRAIDKAFALLNGASDRSETLGEMGWYYQRLAAYYGRQGDSKGDSENLTKAIVQYEQDYKQSPGCFSLANLIQSLGGKFNQIRWGTDTSCDDVVGFVREHLEIVNGFIQKTQYHDYKVECWTLHSALRLLEKVGDKSLCDEIFDRLEYIGYVCDNDDILEDIKAALEMRNSFMQL